jgi:Holliday junction resolvasome RuvABC endonuclease subunit
VRTIVHGWDLALNHSGFVELENGELSNFWYFTTEAGAAKKSKKHGFRLILPTAAKMKDKQQRAMERLTWNENFIKEHILSRNPDYIGIEDYAVRADQGAHQLGEMGGVARMLVWHSGSKLRLHDPISIKMFAAHDGTASKDEVERMVEKRWDCDFSKYNQPISKPTKKNPDPKENRTVSEDLCDAFAIAKLVWTEVQLRAGKILLSDLHEKEVRVFNRVTKSYPVSLLGREWLKNPEPKKIETPFGILSEEEIKDFVRQLLKK